MGRSKPDIERRNIDLCRRYYELTEVQFLRYDKSLEILEHEFYITKPSIERIIRQYLDILREVALKPVPKVRMPHFTEEQVEYLRKFGIQQAESAPPE